ncbi:MAG: hypothetical protein ACR2M0_03185 [Chloroflexia bacterium]
MARAGTREGIIAGVGVGMPAGICVLLFIGSNLPLLTEFMFGLVAGAAGAYLATRAPEATRKTCVRAGLIAGAVMGVFSALAFIIGISQLIGSTEFQRQLKPLAAQVNVSTDSLSGMGIGCTAFFFLLVLPVITAGLGALGGWLVTAWIR